MPHFPISPSRGETLVSLATERLFFRESRYAPGVRLPRHTHDQPYVCLVVRGHFEEACDTETRSCRPASVVVHPAGETHADVFGDGPSRVFSVFVAPELARSVGDYTSALEVGRHLDAGPAVHLATRLYRELREPDAVSPLSMESTTLAMIASLARDGRTDRRPPWLDRVRELLNDRFAESFRHSEIADEVGVHPVHLAQAFRKRFGCSVGEYVRSLRVEFVRRELTRSDATVAALAVAAGFADQAHLTREFRKATGYTPAQYRRLATARR